MRILNCVIFILNKVINDNVNFYKTLRGAFDSEDFSADEKKMITAFSGCILRHYLSFFDLLKRTYRQESDEFKFAIMFFLANNIFLKRINEDDWKYLVHEFMKNVNSEINVEEVIEFINSKTDGSSLIDESIDKSSNYFCSLRFNLPLFLTKMWARSYGKNLTFKIAKGITKSPKQLVRLNTLKLSKEEFENKFSKEFIPTTYEGIYEYVGKNPLKRLPLYQNKKIFAISIAIKEIVNELDLDVIKSYAMYSGCYNSLFLDINISSHNKITLENLIEPKKDYHLFKNEMKQFGFVNNSIIECAPSTMIASLGKKVDTFIVYPSSSSFEQLRLTPDYFLRFDPSTLDQLIQNQKDVLDEAKKYINDNGVIVYVVNTISKKESENIIKQFIDNNNDFVLEKEKQYLPFEQEDSILYYAVLRKKGNND